VSVICNKIEQDRSGGGAFREKYARPEVHVEAGSAYFSQAFGESLALVADLELHDLTRVQLRTQSIAALLGNARDEYCLADRMDSETGLGDYHWNLLQQQATEVGGFVQVLRDARGQGFVAITDAEIALLVAALDKGSYADLTNVYLSEVDAIVALVDSHVNSSNDTDAVAWQEFAWRLNTLFSRAMGLGQAIAIINTYMFRVATVQP